MRFNYDMLSIIGPTAGGKTSVAAHFAALVGGEIISADSRQVYKGMTIGTGKDLNDYVVNGVQVPYHLVDIVEAGEKYNVFQFQKDFKRAYDDIRTRGKFPILCGGSGMYIDAVVCGYNMVEVPPDLKLREELEALSTEELEEKLSHLKTLHNGSDFDSRKRLIRAIEIGMYSDDRGENSSDNINNLYVGILFDRDERRRRITERLNSRLREGMVDEVQALLNSGIKAEDLIYYGLEYKFITEYLIGKLSYEDMVEKLNVAIHQFAKRQMTWFRSMERKGTTIHWIDGFLPMDEKMKVIQRLLGGQ